MRDWIFRLLFPRQDRLLKLLREGSPDFCMTAPEGVSFKMLKVYLTTNPQGQTINCGWVEIPDENAGEVAVRLEV
jgi:hypothetical protein